MMVESSTACGGEDLRLSLSLSSTEISNSSNHRQSLLQMNLMPSTVLSVSSSTTTPSPFSVHHQNNKISWTQTFTTNSSSDRNAAEMFRADTSSGSFLRGIDVNRAPSAIDCEEEAGVSSPNSTVSSISGKRSERDNTSLEENEIERASSRGISDEEDGDPSRKKLRLSKDQSAILEESFKENNTLNPKQKLALAKQLNLRPRQVEVWFQNRRARTKLKQTEVDCEFLKRCCENLTEENRRLQKEVQELRALKMSPQFYMQMTPPTTLTMCPSCERVSAAGTGAAGSASADGRHHHHHQIAMGPHDVHHPQRPNQMINPWAQNAVHRGRALDASAPR